MEVRTPGLSEPGHVHFPYSGALHAGAAQLEPHTLFLGNQCLRGSQAHFAQFVFSTLLLLPPCYFSLFNYVLF